MQIMALCERGRGPLSPPASHAYQDREARGFSPTAPEFTTKTHSLPLGVFIPSRARATWPALTAPSLRAARLPTGVAVAVGYCDHVFGEQQAVILAGNLDGQWLACAFWPCT